MKAIFRYLAIILLFLSLLACNLSSVLVAAQPTNTPKPILPANTAEPIPTVDPNLPTPTEEGALPQSTAFDPCTVVTKEDAEKFLGEPASEPKSVSGGCNFTNAKDGLYAFSIGAAQDKESSNILQGQTMLLGFAGIKMDDAFINEVKPLAENLDYKTFFSKLVAASKSSNTISAKLFSGGGNDLTYWAWITVPPRRQGAFVAIRGTTVVNVNMVVPETQAEETMLNNANRLAGEIFKKLPEKFSIVSGAAVPTAQNQSQPPAVTPTLIVSGEGQPAVNSAPATLAPQQGLQAPNLVSPKDGTVFDTYPRNTILVWEPVNGADKYLVEIMACATNDTNKCFSHPMIEQTTRETTQTTYSFNFVGAQPGKWRVTAIQGKNILGTPSSWWIFKYTK
jgi:hypothetical protein